MGCLQMTKTDMGYVLGMYYCKICVYRYMYHTSLPTRSLQHSSTGPRHKDSLNPTTLSFGVNAVFSEFLQHWITSLRRPFLFFTMSLLLKYINAVHLAPILLALPISWRYFSIVVGGLQCIILEIYIWHLSPFQVRLLQTLNIIWGFPSSALLWHWFL